MQYRHLAWPSLAPAVRKSPERAFLEWAEGTALAENALDWTNPSQEPAECTCVDRCLAEIEQLLRSLDAYSPDH